jgi:hypothetical protein
MNTITLKRQIITDDSGHPVGVILPLDEYALVKDILEHPKIKNFEATKLDQMNLAAKDPLFMADLQESMSLFAEADAEWWEPGS